MNCAHWTIKFCFFAPTLLLSLLLDFQAALAQHQINLGSFNLQRSPYTGDLQLGLGQNANIFGFGADRQLGLNLGPGRFGAKADNGLLLGGQRFGVDTNVGYQEGQGLDLSSFLNLFQPIGQMLNQLRPPPAKGPPTVPISAPTPLFPPPQSPAVNEGWPSSVEEAGGPVLMPTLIPSKATNAGGWPGAGANEERFPPSLGEGWKSGEEEEEGARSSFGASSSLGNEGSRTSSMTGSRRPTVTTEGKFPSEVAEGRIEEKHDADTSGKGKGGTRKGGLPVPDGLEPLKKN